MVVGCETPKKSVTSLLMTLLGSLKIFLVKKPSRPSNRSSTFGPPFLQASRFVLNVFHIYQVTHNIFRAVLGQAGNPKSEFMKYEIYLPYLSRSSRLVARHLDCTVKERN